MLSIIVAKSRNNVIGKDNKLPWHLPDDLKRFKKLTIGHTIIMGRKTFESIGRVLPNRKHIILSKNPDFKIEDENVEVVSEISDLKKYIESEEECFVIGGTMIYNLLLPYTKNLYITQINQDYEGDAHFPEINDKEWKEKEKIKGLKDAENTLDYEYIKYERIK